MITLQTKLDGFPDDRKSAEESEASVIQFPSPRNISTGQAIWILKYRLDDEAIAIWAKTLSIEKVSALETINGITKEELHHALQWIFEHYDFDA